ncbi:MULTISPECIES: M23 family metallopeptidase [Cellulophaga]|jgi:murein DD-endopeptidase MepM/ murein hydrolase activator NlpD|uniref:Peptidase family M23 n=1 Tax=Cellulophaga baltica TaxID=76594 RepID=A0A1G7FQA6_9FLAO|nr:MULTISPECIES: M23 family metallopeptidase [Cellulophaga]AIY12725.1 peptidase M23 [Cellulophaga baltica NN016038]KGK30402.1 peptidase M23 [Cellulophaga sp. E6(2014)]MBA6313750.1 M23 family metallopeptidase [Cellulophaga baltica]MCR1023274.1 M23 family metallopeptidase [Cellulophaga baltica]QXP51188.1 M23 family metallopeptidase [Cellulophaga sp. HaHa_2_1]
MAKKKKKGKDIKKKLLHKYRLVILNENTFEEKISFKLSRLNVFITGSLFIVCLIALTTLLIAFTPLREYIPGYSSTKLKRQATELTYKSDSLVTVLNYTNKYLDNIRKVLNGDITNNQINRDSLFEQFKLDPSSVDLTPIKEDSILRAQVELEDKYNLFERTDKNVNQILFPPINGSVSQDYDPKTKHFAIDIVAAKGTPVKSVADGTVIFSEWTSETGYVIIVEHKDGLLSVYKHNGSLSKEQGDLVRAGEVIASVGNTGELTTGPHLHFELWNNSSPANPKDYIDFK